ncbi:hypothetical protein WICPIJ_007800 [Wickerhamomyces pijperi]|uniref:Uncharacterized protein n=1 Tax=Wickerhamomyces pijperi TaxID=599730 RepID=A0A9P8PZ51_WICPI|nr:hypothetical protein WICPIJ_007800 [Wickerhamomyces pijperi]
MWLSALPFGPVALAPSRAQRRASSPVRLFDQLVEQLLFKDQVPGLFDLHLQRDVPAAVFLRATGVKHLLRDTRLTDNLIVRVVRVAARVPSQDSHPDALIEDRPVVHWDKLHGVAVIVAGLDHSIALDGVSGPGIAVPELHRQHSLVGASFPSFEQDLLGVEVLLDRIPEDFLLEHFLG